MPQYEVISISPLSAGRRVHPCTATGRQAHPLSKVKMDSLVFKNKSRETWTNECERCTGHQQEIKNKRRKRFCMKCDRPSDDLSCYQIREGLKFVWQ